jgi:hypothetical protein
MSVFHLENKTLTLVNILTVVLIFSKKNVNYRKSFD